MDGLTIMTEEEFDASFDLRPFGTGEVIRADAQFRRCAALGVALWGRTSGDLQRQLEARYPEIPPGFDLADFRYLRRTAEKISEAFADPRSSAVVFAGARTFTEWEARCEIVRRAIEYLEKH